VMRSNEGVAQLGACIAALCLGCANVSGDTPAVEPQETATAKTPGETRPQDETDVSQLLNYGLALASQILGEYPGFHPFAFVMEKNGQIGQVALSEGNDHEGAVLLDSLREILVVRAAEGRYRAVAIVADTHIAHGGKETDAIQVGLEHAGGYCVNVYLPYERSEEGAVTLGKAVSAVRQGAVFGPCDPTADG